MFKMEQEGAENIKCKFRFAPKFVQHMHWPILSMGATGGKGFWGRIS